MKVLIEKINEMTGDDDRWGLYAACVPMQKEIKKLILAEQERIIKEIEAKRVKCNHEMSICGCDEFNDGINEALKIIKGEKE